MCAAQAKVTGDFQDNVLVCVLQEADTEVGLNTAGFNQGKHLGEEIARELGRLGEPSDSE